MSEYNPTCLSSLAKARHDVLKHFDAIAWDDVEHSEVLLTFENLLSNKRLELTLIGAAADALSDAYKPEWVGRQLFVDGQRYAFIPVSAR